FAVVRSHVLGAGAVFCGELAAGVVDEDAAHGLGSGAEEMGAIFKGLVAESHPRFVDEGGGLEGMAGLLAGHLRTGELAQFGIYLRQQGAGGFGLAALNSVQKEREIGHGRESLRETGVGGESNMTHMSPATQGNGLSVPGSTALAPERTPRRPAQ